MSTPTPPVPPQGSTSGSEAMNDSLERRLRAVAASADPVPSLVTDAARAVFALRDLDAQLIELVHDSAVDDDAVLVRGDDETRTLTFEHGDVAVDLQVTETPEGYVLLALVDGATGDVVVEHAGGRTTVPLDDAGRVSLDGVPAGPVRLVLTSRDGARVTTSWVSL